MRSSPSKADPLQPTWLGFAHRGLHGPGVPENSLAAFRSAATFTSGAECDVRLASDGVPVVFHDRDLRRLCGTDDRIEACESAWLGGQLLLDTNETIPTLDELLRQWPVHLPLLIECKTCGDNGAQLAETVASALRESPRNAAVMSFDPSIPQWLFDRQAGVPRGLVVDAGWTVDFRSEAVERARPDFLAIDFDLLNDAWTAAMREEIPVYCWTVRTAEQRAQAEVQADALIWEGDGRPGI